MRDGVRRRGRHRPLQRLERQPRLPLHSVNHSEVVEGLREGWVDGDGALVALHRALHVVPLAVQDAEVIPSLGAVRPQAQRVLVRDGGSIEFTNFSLRHAQVVRSLGAVRVQRERAFVRAYRELDVPGRLELGGLVPERDR